MVQDDLEDEAPVLVCVKPAIIMRATPANKLQSINLTCSGVQVAVRPWAKDALTTAEVGRGPSCVPAFLVASANGKQLSLEPQNRFQF